MEIQDQNSDVLSYQQIAIQPISPSELPQNPLVKFDLKFDNLKDYLNEVSLVVNQHGELLKILAKELKGRVSVTDMIEVFGALGAKIPSQLGQVHVAKTSDPWRDQVDFMLQKVEQLSNRVIDLNGFKQKMMKDHQELKKVVGDLPKKEWVLEEIKKLEECFLLKIESEKYEIQELQNSRNLEFQDRFDLIEQKFRSQEINLEDKFKYIQGLLKVSANSDQVFSSISKLEEKLKNQINKVFSDQLQRNKKQIQQLQQSLQALKQNTEVEIEQRNKRLLELNIRLSDKDSLLKKIDQNLKSQERKIEFLSSQEYQGQLTIIKSNILKIQQNLNNSKYLQEKTRLLQRMIDQIKQELNKPIQIPNQKPSPVEPQISIQEFNSLKSDFQKVFSLQTKLERQQKIIQQLKKQKQKQPNAPPITRTPSKSNQFIPQQFKTSLQQFQNQINKI